MESHARPRRRDRERTIVRYKTERPDGSILVTEEPAWRVTAGHYLLPVRYAARGLWWLLRMTVRYGPSILGTAAAIAGAVVAGAAMAVVIAVGLVAFPLIRYTVEAWEGDGY